MTKQSRRKFMRHSLLGIAAGHSSILRAWAKRYQDFCRLLNAPLTWSANASVSSLEPLRTSASW